MATLQQRLKAACDNTDGECTYRNAYAGRMMFNRRCVGVAGPMHLCRELLAEIACNLMQEVFDAAIDCHAGADGDVMAAEDLNNQAQQDIDVLFAFEWDSMGRDVILYFKSLEPIEGDVQ